MEQKKRAKKKTGPAAMSPASKKAARQESQRRYKDKKRQEKNESGDREESTVRTPNTSVSDTVRIRLKRATIDEWRLLKGELELEDDDALASYLLTKYQDRCMDPSSHLQDQTSEFQERTSEPASHFQDQTSEYQEYSTEPSSHFKDLTSEEERRSVHISPVPEPLHVDEEGRPFMASTPTSAQLRGDKVRIAQRNVQCCSPGVPTSLPSPVHSNNSVQQDKQSPSQIPSPRSSSEDFNLSVSFMEKGDFIFPHEKEDEDEDEDDCASDWASDAEADVSIELGNGDDVEGLQHVGQEDIVLGDTPAEDLPSTTTRSGLHTKCTAGEAADIGFFLISDKRLEALAREAYSKCGRCQLPVSPKISPANGTAAHVYWICPEGHTKSFCTQETINRSHIGDLRLASSILLSGNNFAKVQLMAKFAKINFLSPPTFYKVQGNYCIPAIESQWANVQQKVLQKHSSSPVVVCGDARNDSPGFCAQYCTYTFMEHETKDVLYVGIVDKREAAMKSPNMEAKAFKAGLATMIDEGLDVQEVVTDAHSSIAKYMRESRPNIKHSWDTWHGAKNLGKKLAKASSRASTRGLLYWIKHVVGHFWYCSEKCEQSVGAFKAMWHGLTHHVTNKHTWVSGLNGANECDHGPLPEREEWLKPGSDAHRALVQVCYDKKFLDNMKYFSRFRHTSMLESMHNHILMYASKRYSFQYPAYRARNLLAVLDFMAHKDRADQTDEHGNIKRVAVWSKHSSAYVTRRLKVPKEYQYIDGLIGDIFERRESDEEPMFRRASLRFDDPRLLQPRLAPFPAPSIETILARRAGNRQPDSNLPESEVD